MEANGQAKNSVETKEPGELKSTFKQNKWIVALCIFTGLCIIAAIVFATAAATTGNLSFWLIPANTAYAVLILRALSEGASLSLTALMAWTFCLFLWTSVSSPEGLRSPRCWQ